MDQAGLFGAALGLHPPWRVTGVHFDEKKGELEINIDFEKGARFACPECQALCPVHDTKKTTWRHLDFFQHKTMLTARHPRTNCPEHEVRKVDAPWARSRTGFTFLFEAMVLALVPHMPVKAIARNLREHDTRIWRIVEHYVEAGRSRADHSEVTTIGLDETSQRKHHHYISIFMDLDEARVLFATPGRKADAVREFREDLEAHGGKKENIEVACIDMSPSYRLGIQQEFPNAKITYDRFHVMKLVNDALDKTRRQERQRYIGLKRSKYLWLKNPNNLTSEQLARVEELSQEYPDTALAYQLKLSILAFWDEKPRKAKKRLKAWILWARNTHLVDFQRLADTLEEHFDGILAWHKTRVTNGILEGINSLVQAAKAKARGYSNPRTMINMTYLIAGRLPLALPT
jgi:transposase